MSLRYASLHCCGDALGADLRCSTHDVPRETSRQVAHLHMSTDALEGAAEDALLPTRPCVLAGNMRRLEVFLKLFSFMRTGGMIAIEVSSNFTCAGGEWD